MKQLKADFDYKHYLTIYVYCTVFPIEKTKNGFYKCHLRYNKDEKDCVIEWIIPAEYLEEKGSVKASKDVYFARWLARTVPEIMKDENGNEVKDEDGNIKVEKKLHLGRLIEFWNTRVFGVGSEPFETSK